MIIGGHAIILELELPKEIEDMANRWVMQDPTRRARPDLTPHMTLLFVGRDLHVNVGRAMIEVVSSSFAGVNVPKMISTSGPIRMFGARHNHLAVLLNGEQLRLTRAAMKSAIQRAANMTIKDGFGFNPHVSIGIGSDDDRPPATNLRRYDLKVTNITVKIGNSLSMFPVI